MSLHDDEMPKGWHTIKSVLLKEIHTAANFHLCCLAADALFHARLVGEGCAKKGIEDEMANPKPTDVPPSGHRIPMPPPKAQETARAKLVDDIGDGIRDRSDRFREETK